MTRPKTVLYLVCVCLISGLNMAAEGSTAVTSDELFDYLCSLCNKKDRNSEAVKYCVDCQEYLCVTCEESHNGFPVLAGHTVVGRSKFGNASVADTKQLPSVPTERCKVHSMKLVDMYCADHDSVGCHVCFTINHKDYFFDSEHRARHKKSEKPYKFSCFNEPALGDRL